MFKKTALTILTLLLSTPLAHSFNKSSLKLLESPFVFQAQQNLPPDVSYIFADLKFDGERLQLCEFGPCPYAGLTDAPVHVDNQQVLLTSPYWELFWHFLNEFNIPMIRIGGWDPMEANKILHTLHGKRYQSIDGFLSDHTFQDLFETKGSPIKSINHALALIVFTGSGSAHKRYHNLTLDHPNLIFINHYLNKIVSRKDTTNMLCKQPNLAHFKPKSKICPTTYTPTLAQSIINEFDTSHYLIKPLSSMRGSGIIMVTKKDLDPTLKTLFDKASSNKKSIYKAGFWLDKKQKQFIAEAYAPSKKVRFDGELYDPTMRLICFLAHNRGVITIHVVGGYWKTPRYPLNKKCDLTLKHITEAGVGERRAIAPHDLKIAKRLCADLMYNVYSTVLARSIT